MSELIYLALLVGAFVCVALLIVGCRKLGGAK